MVMHHANLVVNTDADQVVVPEPGGARGRGAGCLSRTRPVGASAPILGKVPALKASDERADSAALLRLAHGCLQVGGQCRLWQLFARVGYEQLSGFAGETERWGAMYRERR